MLVIDPVAVAPAVVSESEPNAGDGPVICALSVPQFTTDEAVKLSADGFFSDRVPAAPPLSWVALAGLMASAAPQPASTSNDPVGHAAFGVPFSAMETGYVPMPHDCAPALICPVQSAPDLARVTVATPGLGPPIAAVSAPHEPAVDAVIETGVLSGFDPPEPFCFVDAGVTVTAVTLHPADTTNVLLVCPTIGVVGDEVSFTL